MKLISTILALATFATITCLIGVAVTWPFWLWGYRRSSIGRLNASALTASTRASAAMYVIACLLAAIAFTIAVGVKPSPLTIAASAFFVGAYILCAYAAEQLGEKLGYRTYVRHVESRNAAMEQAAQVNAAYMGARY